ncbi:MAG: hypothetical protein KatS3mg007_1837 [Thermoanaerobaculum sp.]|nr:MAG: hypothetical protein KatS3mg007_1837 [Thermoanaerobaculum sp.]GBC80191.1 hypothetical protein HRbin09_01425 [bacterium HR09]
MKRYLVLVALVLGLGVGETQQPMEQQRLDGNWWLSLSDREQEMFTEGFLDCACFYRVRSFCPRGIVAVDLAEQTTLYFCRARGEGSELVRDAFAKLATRATRFPLPGGEPAHGPHSGNDGEFWRGALYDLQAKAAFVGGYLECYRHVVKGDLDFPGSAEEYARKIDEWYGFDETQDSIRPGTEDVPIADVLMKFGIPKGASKPKNGKR